ncbi:dihydrofolate reductase [Salinisphaera sp. SPP-AMP-43]|uniref:dihydrofolate reductase n=1 Tax=Salinisphaera sp. SPP-AMP-43 TaxID=3121288 RepID=UPI003C6DEFF3
MTTEPRLTLIVAMDRQGVIGADGGMPWHLPEDLRWFKQQTSGKPILMGRKTFESIGRALPKRRNLVITRRPDSPASGAETVTSVEQAKGLCQGEDELMVIGGAEIYALALPEASGLLVTRIEAEYAGDTVFPEVDWNEWRLVDEQPRAAEQGRPAYCFMTYQRVAG